MPILRTRPSGTLLFLLSVAFLLPSPSICQSVSSASQSGTAMGSTPTSYGPPPEGIDANATHPLLDNLQACWFPPDPAKPPGNYIPAQSYDGYRVCPPKTPGVGHSMCCQTYPQGNNNRDDWCYNGLCYQPGASKGSVSTITRVACTDPTFQDPGCLNICLGMSGSVSGVGRPARVRKCDGSDMYCCGTADQTDTTECCNSWTGFYITWPANSTHPIITNSTGPPKYTPNPENTKLSSALASDSTGSTGKNRPGDSNPNVGVIVGIVMVSVLLVALIAVGVLWFRQRKRWKKRSQEHVYDKFNNRSSMLIGSDTNFGVKAELDATPRVDELDGYPMAPGLRSDSCSEMGSPVSRPGTAGRMSRMSTFMTDRRFDRPLSELPGSEVRTGQEVEMETGDVSRSNTGVSGETDEITPAESKNEGKDKGSKDRPDSSSTSQSASSGVSPASASGNASSTVSEKSKDSTSLRNRSSSRSSKSSQSKSSTATATADPDHHSIYELP